MANDRRRYADPAPDTAPYVHVLERMAAKADRDSRAFWIARALGCSSSTKATLDTLAARSHAAWERARRRLVAAQGPVGAYSATYVHPARYPATDQDPALSSPDAGALATTGPGWAGNATRCGRTCGAGPAV
jgi:hypothetical protein